METTGTGNLSITGTGGGNGSGCNNYGIYLDHDTINTVSGTLTFTGIDGSGSGGGNYGIYVDNGGTSTIGGASETGNISYYANDWTITTADFSSKTSGALLLDVYSSGTSIGCRQPIRSNTLIVSSAILDGI